MSYLIYKNQDNVPVDKIFGSHLEALKYAREHQWSHITIVDSETEEKFVYQPYQMENTSSLVPLAL